MDVTGDRTNEKFGDVAKTDYSLSGAYSREVLGVSWLNRLGWSWKSEIANSPGDVKYFRDQGFDVEESLVNQPPAGILDARSGLSFVNGLDIGVFGKNLTDERRFAALAFSRGLDAISRFYYGSPRELGLDVKYRF